MNKGIVFALEASIAIMLFAIISTTLIEKNNNTLTELIVLQQENDLLKVWSYSFPRNEEIIKDASLLFGEKVTIKKNEIILKKGIDGKNCVSSKGKIFNEKLNEEEIILIVCYN